MQDARRADGPPSTSSRLHPEVSFEDERLLLEAATNPDAAFLQLQVPCDCIFYI